MENNKEELNDLLALKELGNFLRKTKNTNEVKKTYNENVLLVQDARQKVLKERRYKKQGK